MDRLFPLHLEPGATLLGVVVMVVVHAIILAFYAIAITLAVRVALVV